MKKIQRKKPVADKIIKVSEAVRNRRTVAFSHSQIQESFKSETQGAEFENYSEGFSAKETGGSNPGWMKKESNPGSQSNRASAKNPNNKVDSKATPRQQQQPNTGGRTKKELEAENLQKFNAKMNEAPSGGNMSRRKVLAKTVALDKASSDFINNLISSGRTMDI